jgi:DNA-binding beta-propeller fold protein YncE
MSKDPAGRFPSAGDLASAATAAVAGRPVSPREHSVATGGAAPLPLQAARARRWRPRAVTAGIAIAAGGALIAWTALTGDGGGDSSVRRPPAAVTKGRVLRVPGTPGAVAVAGGAVWTMTIAGGGLQRTDPDTGRSTAFTAPADLGGGEFPDLESGAGTLWQVQSFETSGGVTKVDPQTGTALGRARVPGASAVVVARGGVWASARRGAGGQLVRIEPGSVRVVAGPVAAGRDPVAVSAAAGSVWVADRRRDTVLRFDPQTLRLRARLRVGDGPAAFAAFGDTLWVADLGDRTLTHIDAARGEVVGAPVRLGKEIEAIARSPSTLWVAAADATVTRLDPETGAVRGASVDVGRPPLSLAVDGDGVWVASAADGTVQHLRLAAGTPR